MEKSSDEKRSSSNYYCLKYGVLTPRRLVFWADCLDKAYLIYEHGGFGKHIHIIELVKTTSIYKVSRNISMANKPSSLEEMKVIMEKEIKKDARSEHF